MLNAVSFAQLKHGVTADEVGGVGGIVGVEGDDGATACLLRLDLQVQLADAGGDCGVDAGHIAGDVRDERRRQHVEEVGAARLLQRVGQFELLGAQLSFLGGGQRRRRPQHVATGCGRELTRVEAVLGDVPDLVRIGGPRLVPVAEHEAEVVVDAYVVAVPVELVDDRALHAEERRVRGAHDDACVGVELRLDRADRGTCDGFAGADAIGLDRCEPRA